MLYSIQELDESGSHQTTLRLEARQLTKSLNKQMKSDYRKVENFLEIR